MQFPRLITIFVIDLETTVANQIDCFGHFLCEIFKLDFIGVDFMFLLILHKEELCI